MHKNSPLPKNYETGPSAKVTLEGHESITVDLYSHEGFELLSNLWIKVGAHFRLMYEPTWLGRQIIQFPTDIVAFQEIVWNVKPDVIIETGVAHGGSLILSASLLELCGHGKVIGIDVDIRDHNRKAIDAHPLRRRIELIEGSSIDVETIDRVRGMLNPSDKVLVVLDSNHSDEHVFNELEAYGDMVSLGSYIVANDGAQAWVWDTPNGKPEWKLSHPLQAIERFLSSHPEFAVDPQPTRWLITQSPQGYLQRVSI